MMNMNSLEEKQNLFFHRTLIPILYSILWLGALILSCYSVWSDAIEKGYKEMCFFLIIYCTFMFEGGLVWWDIMAVNYEKAIRLKDFSFIRTIFFNMALTLVAVVLFFVTKLFWLVFAVMVVSAWLKFIVCRITPKIEMADVPYYANEYRLQELD